MDVKAAPDERGPARTAKSCGPGLPVLRSSLRMFFMSTRATGAKQPVPGEITYKS
jgi:hypothetical protein